MKSEIPNKKKPADRAKPQDEEIFLDRRMNGVKPAKTSQRIPSNRLNICKAVTLDKKNRRMNHSAIRKRYNERDYFSAAFLVVALATLTEVL